MLALKEFLQLLTTAVSLLLAEPSNTTCRQETIEHGAVTQCVATANGVRLTVAIMTERVEPGL